jgi:nitrate reductase (cytochrome), electron transfer subunit
MSARAATGGGTPLRVLLIVAAAAVMLSAVLYLGQGLVSSREAARPAAAGPIASPGSPIASEADVFRTRPGDLAVAPAGERRTTSHPRTLATFRRVRAFPGAPPRIPHGISADEHRGTTCNACHERGGFSPRFGAYAPVTPHPEYAACQQCHVADARVVGTTRADGSASSLCTQCHAMGEVLPPPAASEWTTRAWPATAQRAMPGSPPRIPHDFHLRGNCVACHAGPGAVAEIRTTHPERANCRQCHLPAPAGVPEFTRSPASDEAPAREGAR